MSTLNVANVNGGSGAKSVNDIVSGYAKAWVRFNGTGTVAISSAFNVTSITDNAVGQYTANLTNAMSDANSCVVATSQGAQIIMGIGTTTASAIPVTCFDKGGNAYFDANPVCVSVFR